MAKVKVYTTQHCPHCQRAKRLLESKNASFEEIDLTNDDKTRSALEKKTGWATLPMIFIGDEFIGGSDDLHALDDQGKLDGKLSNSK